MTQVRQSPQTVQNVVTYDVVVGVDNTDLVLKPGMTAATRIVIDQRDDVLRVPTRRCGIRPAGAGAAAIVAQRRRSGAGLGAARRAAGGRAGDHRPRRRHLHRNRQGRPEGRRSGHRRRAAWTPRKPRGAAPAALKQRPKRPCMAEPVIRDRARHADLSRRRRRRARAARRQPHRRARRIRRHHGLVGIGQIDADGDPRLPRPADERALLFRRLDVAQLERAGLARIRSERLGFVFQSFNLLARTSAIENVALPLFYAASGPAGAASRIERARAALAARPGERERNTPGQLSGGQQQRVAIARALINASEPAACRRADRQPRYAHLARDHGDAGIAQPRTGRHHHRRHPRGGYRAPMPTAW